MEHPISELFKISLDCIKDMIDVNTIVGEAIKVDERTSIIPVSKVKCAFATGGCDQRKRRRRRNASTRSAGRPWNADANADGLPCL